MTNLHVIYRREPGDTGSWATYSYPLGIYTGGATLAEARAQFREAATFGLDDFEDFQLVEHIEELSSRVRSCGSVSIAGHSTVRTLLTCSG